MRPFKFAKSITLMVPRWPSALQHQSIWLTCILSIISMVMAETMPLVFDEATCSQSATGYSMEQLQQSYQEALDMASNAASLAQNVDPYVIRAFAVMTGNLSMVRNDQSATYEQSLNAQEAQGE